MKRIFIALLFMLPAVMNAQDCKYEKNTIDEFTKSKVVITKLQKVWAELAYGSMAVQGIRVDNLYSLNVNLLLNHVFAIQKDADLMILLENDSFVKYHLVCIFAMLNLVKNEYFNSL